MLVVPSSSFSTTIIPVEGINRWAPRGTIWTGEWGQGLNLQQLTATSTQVDNNNLRPFFALRVRLMEVESRESRKVGTHF